MVTSVMRAGESTLSRGAAMVAAARGDFDRLSATMSSELASKQAGWQGEGGRAFFRLQAAWAEKQGRIVAALDRFESALVATERDNHATDQAQSDQLSRYQSRLDGVAGL